MNRARKYTAFGAAALALTLSCDENLPSGPTSFSAGVTIVVPRDTLVVGDSSSVQARVTDTQGRVIQGLTFTWASADTNILGFATVNTSDSDAVAGRTRRFVGKRPGRSAVTLTLPDSRFVAVAAQRNETVVVGGVRVLTSRDTTQSAINDTSLAIAAGLVRVNGALVTRASQGIRWTHRGTNTSVVGSGDTIRFISRTNGVDTLIATHDFCLAGAKCADTVIARVAQSLSLGLSTRTFQVWSFSDSVAPTIVLADRRGNGQSGTSIRFVPRTASDSAIVKVSAPVGTSNPVTGLMAAPRLVSSGNGTARVQVQGIAADGFTVVATDSVTVTVRQVARRAQVEPLRGILSSVDSIPIKPVARDARGAIIADATVDITPVGITVNGIWAGPTSLLTTQGTIIPQVTGVALPVNNPLAPQVPIIVDAAVITLLAPDSVVAGATSRTISVPVLDSVGNPALGRWVRFRTNGGTVADSAIVDFTGNASVVWTPPDIAGTYTLTGVRSAPVLFSLADSAGRIVVRQSLLVVADIPSVVFTTAQISTTTVAQNATATLTVTVKDRFGNIVKSATPAAFTPTVSAGGGTVGAFTCVQGVCTATYTAPNAATTATITVQIAAADVVGSPITVTVP